MILIYGEIVMISRFPCLKTNTFHMTIWKFHFKPNMSSYRRCIRLLRLTFFCR